MAGKYLPAQAFHSPHPSKQKPFLRVLKFESRELTGCSHFCNIAARLCPQNKTAGCPNESYRHCTSDTQCAMPSRSRGEDTGL